MTYVDGFVLPLPEGNRERYRTLAEKAGAIWKEHGALSYVECIADDIGGEWKDGFFQAARTQPGETVVFAFITYDSRAHRDAVNAKVMADPRMQEICPGQNPEQEMPFDVTRMAYAGFKPIVNL